MHQSITALKTDQNVWTPEALLEEWHHSLQEKDRSAGTIKKYTQAAARFLAWYEREERAALTLETLTPIALIGYRNELQHEQHKSFSTINLQMSALRSWCGWMTEQGYLAADPAAHVKLVGGEAASSRKGLKSAQVNALLHQAQASRNYAIVQVLLQAGLRLSECAALTYSDIAFGERSGLLCIRAGKGNKARSVPVNASAREAIAAYVALRLGVEKPSLKAVATAWPTPKSEHARAPLWLSQKGGVNKLIQDGAKPVMEVKDILEALNLFMIPQHVEMKEVLPDNDDERVLLKLISHEPCHVDELIRGSGLATTTVSSTLMMMELKGMIRQLGGMQYVLAR